MALSGTINGTTNNEYIKCRIDWTATQSITGNYSDVTAKLYYWRTNSYKTTGTVVGNVTINGTSTAYSKYASIGTSAVLVATVTTRVNHSSDGTKSCTISATGAINGASLNSTSLSGTASLTTIARATVPSLSASSVVMGNTVTISLPRASSSFTHKLTYKVGSHTGTISSSAGASYTWEVPTSFGAYIPNETSVNVTITCITYSGSTSIGQKEVSFKATVPAYTPTASFTSVTEATSGLASKFGVFIQSKSKLKVVISHTSNYGSTLKSVSSTVDGLTYSGTTFTTSAIKSSGTVKITSKVTDSRGKTSTITRNVSVVAYSEPTISSFSASRINTSGTADDSGTRLKITANWSITDIDSKNTHTYSVKYKLATDSTYSNITSSASASYNYNSSISYTSSPELDVDHAYTIQLSITDYFGTVTKTFNLPTSFTLLDFRSTGKGFAVGKVSEKDAFECALNAEFKGNVTIDGNINRDISSFVWSPNNISTSGQTQIIKKFPSLDVCFFKCYCKTAKQFVEGSSYLVGTVDSGFYPSYLTPLCVYVAGHKNADAWVESDGKIYVYAGETISSNISVYINGTWMTN